MHRGNYSHNYFILFYFFGKGFIISNKCKSIFYRSQLCLGLVKCDPEKLQKIENKAK